MRKTILPILIIFFVSAFVGFTFALPKFAREVEKTKLELRLLEQEEKEIPKLQELLTLKKEQVMALEQAFPSKKEMVSVVQLFDAIAAETQVQASLHFESENITPDKNGDFTIPVSLTIEGKFLNIIRFLESLSQGKYFYVWHTVESNSPNGIKEINKMTVWGKLYASNR